MTRSITTLGIAPGSERDSGGVVTAYTRAPNGDLLGFRRNSARYYYLYDGLGSVAAVTDANGAVVNRYSYDPYGNALATTEQVTQPYRYAGAYLDNATSLYKMGARYYDPATGRFTQRDAMPASSYNPLEYNRYTYVAGNPVNATDATGYAQWCDDYCSGSPRRYQGGSGSRGIRGITTPLYTSRDIFGGQHNHYFWGQTGMHTNRSIRAYWTVSGTVIGAAGGLLGLVPHPLARGAAVIGIVGGAGLIVAGQIYPRGWGWRYIQPRYGPTIEFPWYRGWR